MTSGDESGYNFAHIGNLRTYVFEDVLKRTLEYFGYDVTHIMNITDVDDKTIRGAKEHGMTLKTFTRKYETIFKDDLKKLNILFPTRFTRATDHIKPMIETIEILLARKFAYEQEGSVYFDVSKFKPYGKLAHLDASGLRAGARIDADEYGKQEAQDFVLWKARKDNEPFWKSPFGPGRPGWHIECSVMATKYLGQPFDIHAAAVDLIFPHHENEIAQAEAANKKQFANYWLHGEHLLISGQKMSKSLSNIFTLHDVAEEHASPLAFRYLVLGAHYRTQLNFTWESLHAAQKSLDTLVGVVQELKTTKKKNSTTNGKAFLIQCKKKFEEAIADDLNTAKALATVWELVHEYRKNHEALGASEVLRTINLFDQVLGLNLKNIQSDKIPSNIATLAKAREEARHAKDFATSDDLRAQIKSLGWSVEDTPEGPRLKKTS